MPDPYLVSLPKRRLAVGLCGLCSATLLLLIGMKLAEGPLPTDPDARVKRLETRVDEQPSKDWVDLAFAYSNAGEYHKAPEAFAKAAAYYRSIDDENAAIQMEMKAEKFEADARIYVEKPATPTEQKLAKFEPATGCLLGAFIDNEDMLKKRYPDRIEFVGGSNRKPSYTKQRAYVGPFDEKIGVKHAVFFLYVGYGVRFPAKWAADLRGHGAAAQIAFEPHTLDDVKDDEYLRQFARDAKASGIPVFLRFASEMNGNWTSYHGDPKKYIEKWRLVTRVMREEAPNVAMLWCVFETPITKVEMYYPGQEWVDWVGVNVYSVPFFNNDAKQPAFWRNPADGAEFVYRTYADKHPIMVAEYASSHLSSLDNVYRGPEARVKLAQFYASLPRLYPRIKAVCWLSMNAIEHAIPGRQKNNYSLLYDMPKTKRYREMVSNPYFLTTLSLDDVPNSPIALAPLAQKEVLSGRVKLSAWARCWENEPTVSWLVNGKEVAKTKLVGEYPLELDTTKLPNGLVKIGLNVVDSKGRLAASASVDGIVEN